jgi:uncharacterized protein
MDSRSSMGRSRLAALAVLAAVAAALLGACERGDRLPDHQDYVPLVAFDTTTAYVIGAQDTFRLHVEIAEREDQRAFGLMERPALPADAGMIFLYREQQDADAGFWMYRTRIPLDIAFFDADGTILTIRHMDPCPHADPRGCPSYPPGVPYHGALEVNRGYFAARGIGAGHRVVLRR